MSRIKNCAMNAAATATAIARPLMKTTRALTSEDCRGTWAASSVGPMETETGKPSVVDARSTSFSCSAIVIVFKKHSRRLAGIDAKQIEQTFERNGQLNQLRSAHAAQRVDKLFRRRGGRRAKNRSPGPRH